MLYGQIVLGPPGSGKSTYCCTLQKYYEAIDRKCIVVNLDPANDNILYKCDIDITELITLQDAMSEFVLGPNGGLLFCMEFLLKNLEWLFTRLAEFPNHYVLFDFPGQVELFIANDNIKSIISQLDKHSIRLVAVNLVDSFYCSNPEVFISAGLTSLISMINLELPAVNILSKIDLISKFGSIEYDLDYYTELPDMTRMLFRVDQRNRMKEDEKSDIDDEIDEKDEIESRIEEVCDEEEFVNRPKDPFQQKYRKLYWMLCDIVDDYGLLSYLPLDIQSPTSVAKIVEMTDKANGFSLFSYMKESGQADPEMLVFSKNDGSLYDMVDDMNEKYVHGEDDFDDDDDLI